jgi:hypothetical protein
MKALAAIFGSLLVVTVTVLVAVPSTEMKSTWQQLATTASSFIDSHHNMETAHGDANDEWSTVGEIDPAVTRASMKAESVTEQQLAAPVRDAETAYDQVMDSAKLGGLAKFVSLAQTQGKKLAKKGGNGETGYDHSLDPQDFRQHEAMPRTGETVIGQKYADRSMWANNGRGIDLKAKHAKMMALAQTQGKKLAKKGGNGETGYDHSLDPQDFRQHEALPRNGETVIGNSVKDLSMWGNNGRGVDLKANKAKLMALAETAAKKAIKSNGETGYDHSLDPQDFPQHEGLARAGETVIGNSVADQSTWGNNGRGIDMKGKNAKMSILAAAAKAKAAAPAKKAAAKEDGGNPMLAKLKAKIAHWNKAQVEQGLKEDPENALESPRRDPGLNGGWPEKKKLLQKIPDEAFNAGGIAAATAEFQNRNGNQDGSMAEVQRLIADNDPAVARRIDRSRAAFMNGDPPFGK